MKARLYLDVEFDGRKTDGESIAVALDKVVETGMSALNDCWDEYGGQPKVGQFLVLDTKQANELAEGLDSLVQGGKEELGSVLVPIQEFLRQIAGKKALKTSQVV